MGNATIIYRLTDYGADATAHADGEFFIVYAGSRFGAVRNAHDHVMLNYRRAIARDFSFDEASLTLNEDVKPALSRAASATNIRGLRPTVLILSSARTPGCSSQGRLPVATRMIMKCSDHVKTFRLL